MQSAVQSQPKLRLSLMALACSAACFSMSAAQAQTETEASAAKPAEVIVTAKKLGMGLMVNETAPKARSTITAEELEKQRPTGNAFQALEMLPAVNSYNYDATGLFGGGLTMRGFNSDQIGATINGVPVNDSGAFAVYPQEYVDQENTCSETVTQGSTDVDSPQVGATGGNFSIFTCSPEDKQRVRVMQTLGQLNLTKSYVRVDSGRLSDGRSKFFMSYSHAEADKWKGKGSAKRDHFDAGFDYDIDKFNYIHATLLYNEAMNNNINSLSLAQIRANGYNYDFSEVVPPQTIPVGTTTANLPATYWRLANNPFKNAIASATAKFRLGENTDIKIVPYFWYGFGNGGVQQKYFTESSAFLNKATGLVNAGADINGDGDTNDRVLVANASVTHTTRPGVTTSVTHTIGNHELLAGFWYERANHRQTGTAVRVGTDGKPFDDYLDSNVILRADGTPYQSRDWKTISTAYQAFIQDTISLMDDKLQVNVGIRTPHIKRDFTNYANEGSRSGTTYNIQRSYNDVLPQLGLRYQLTADDQLFASMAKNMKAPGNFVFSTANNVTIVNGVPTLSSQVAKEISYNTDIGYRHQGKQLISSVTVYNVDFRDRQATAYNPLTLVSVLTNVGKVSNRGIELEIGNTPINGWSFYGSFGYSKSEIKENLRANATTFIPTAGNEFPLTPKLKAGLSAEYGIGSFYGRLKAKATGKQQATLANDEEVPGYTTLDFDTGYTFANMGWLKRPKVMFNISNLTDKQYRNPSSQSVVNASAYGNASANTVYYYLGAPRMASVTFSGDF